MKISLLTMTAALAAAQDPCQCIHTNSCPPQSACALEYKTTRKVIKKGWDKPPKAPKVPKMHHLHKGKPCADCPPPTEETQKVVYRIEPEFIDAKPEAYTVVTTERRRGKYTSVPVGNYAAPQTVTTVAAPVQYVDAAPVISESAEAAEKRSWLQSLKGKLRRSDKQQGEGSVAGLEGQVIATSGGCAKNCGSCPACTTAAVAAPKMENVKYVTLKVPVESRTHFTDRKKLKAVARQIAKGKCVEGTDCGNAIAEAPVVEAAAPVVTVAAIPAEAVVDTDAPITPVNATMYPTIEGFVP